MIRIRNSIRAFYRSKRNKKLLMRSLKRAIKRRKIRKMEKRKKKFWMRAWDSLLPDRTRSLDRLSIKY
jgi:hypothetical protein